MTAPAAAAHRDFAARLRSARLRTGKSQEKIAAEVGTSRRHWIRWENGSHRPSPAYILRIAEATGRAPDYFTDSPRPDTTAAADDDEEADPMAALLAALRRVVREEMAGVR